VIGFPPTPLRFEPGRATCPTERKDPRPLIGRGSFPILNGRTKIRTSGLTLIRTVTPTDARPISRCAPPTYDKSPPRASPSNPTQETTGNRGIPAAKPVETGRDAPVCLDARRPPPIGFERAECQRARAVVAVVLDRLDSRPDRVEDLHRSRLLFVAGRPPTRRASSYRFGYRYRSVTVKNPFSVLSVVTDRVYCETCDGAVRPLYSSRGYREVECPP
jgi:hypothetical protein